MNVIKKREAFTLIELLVSIAIIAVLVSLLLPAVQQAREAARMTACKNNLKQLALGVIQYTELHQAFPRAFHVENAGGSNRQLWSWSAKILPFIEQGALYEKINIEDDWRTAENLPSAKTRIELLQCPSAPQNAITSSSAAVPGCHDAAETNYAAIVGPERLPTGSPYFWSTSGVWHDGGGVRTNQLTDGLTSTLLIGEADRTADHPDYPECAGLEGWNWAYICRVSVGYGINHPQQHPSDPHVFAYHRGGAQFAFVDGHVSFINENIDQSLLDALATRAGGEVIGEY